MVEFYNFINIINFISMRNRICLEKYSLTVSAEFRIIESHFILFHHFTLQQEGSKIVTWTEVK